MKYKKVAVVTKERITKKLNIDKGIRQRGGVAATLYNIEVLRGDKSA